MLNCEGGYAARIHDYDIDLISALNLYKEVCSMSTGYNTTILLEQYPEWERFKSKVIREAIFKDYWED